MHSILKFTHILTHTHTTHQNILLSLIVSDEIVSGTQKGKLILLFLVFLLLKQFFCCFFPSLYSLNIILQQRISSCLFVYSNKCCIQCSMYNWTYGKCEYDKKIILYDKIHFTHHFPLNVHFQFIYGVHWMFRTSCTIHLWLWNGQFYKRLFR